MRMQHWRQTSSRWWRWWQLWTRKHWPTAPGRAASWAPQAAQRWWAQCCSKQLSGCSAVVMAAGDGSDSTGSSSGSLPTQELSNLAWVVAVLDLRQHAKQTHVLARACSQQWHAMAAAEVWLWQLHQVQLWLLDGQLAGGQGLLGLLPQQQLQQCKQAWDAGLATATSSQLQADVLAALRCLRHAWQQPPAAEQLAQPDGALSIDVTAVTAGGELLVVEVDGPWHYRQPDGGLTGSTLYRNRALAARGYRVVSVPGHEWYALRGVKQAQQRYLERLLFGSSEQAVSQGSGGKRQAVAAPARGGDVRGSTQPAGTQRVVGGGSSGRRPQQQVQPPQHSAPPHPAGAQRAAADGGGRRQRAQQVQRQPQQAQQEPQQLEQPQQAQQAPPATRRVRRRRRVAVE